MRNATIVFVVAAGLMILNHQGDDEAHATPLAANSCQCDLSAITERLDALEAYQDADGETYPSPIAFPEATTAADCSQGVCRQVVGGFSNIRQPERQRFGTRLRNGLRQVFGRR